jgi:hypothetical protein
VTVFVSKKQRKNKPIHGTVRSQLAIFFVIITSEHKEVTSDLEKKMSHEVAHPIVDVPNKEEAASGLSALGGNQSVTKTDRDKPSPKRARTVSEAPHPTVSHSATAAASATVFKFIATVDSKGDPSATKLHKDEPKRVKMTPEAKLASVSRNATAATLIKCVDLVDSGDDDNNESESVKQISKRRSKRTAGKTVE